MNSVALVLHLGFNLVNILKLAAVQLNVGEVCLTREGITLEAFLAIGDEDTVNLVFKGKAVKVLRVDVTEVRESCIALVNCTVAVSDDNVRLNGKILHNFCHVSWLWIMPYLPYG